MAVEYLACGNIMSDRIERQDGSFSEWNMGGPAFFALSGIRLWTKACKLVCRTGEDYASTYGRWMLSLIHISLAALLFFACIRPLCEQALKILRPRAGMSPWPFLSFALQSYKKALAERRPFWGPSASVTSPRRETGH